MFQDKSDYSESDGFETGEKIRRASVGCIEGELRTIQRHIRRN